jgi:hypothetical protein
MRCSRRDNPSVAVSMFWFLSHKIKCYNFWIWKAMSEEKW